MKVDIVILSDSKNGRLKEYTQQTIDSCHKAETTIKFNVFVLESDPDTTHQRCTTIPMNEPFNYNGFMNKGIALGKAEYVCLCNNDLLFQANWCSNIIDGMEAHGLLSASPYCSRNQGVEFKEGKPIEFGYRNHYEMSGWCIMCHRDIFQTIGEIDSEFPFWFADNAYSEQLKSFGVKHALVRSSMVMHLGSKTLKTLDAETNKAYTEGLVKRFVEKYPLNESSIYFKKVYGL